MAWIRTLHPDEAEGELADLYRRVANPDGSIDNIMSIHSLNPQTLRTHFDMYVEAMHKPSPLSRVEREMVAVAVSRVNGCAYCLRHHAAGLQRLLPDDRKYIADELSNGDDTEVSDRESSMIDFATKLTMRPAQMSEKDVDALRIAGLDDRAILDLVQCIGYFNYVNRIVTGLGVRLGEGEGPQGEWPTT